MGSRVVIYTRVSKDDSGEGKSNDRQAEDCRKLASLRGWEVVEELADISISAYTGVARPSWQRVIEMARAGQCDVILAWHLDRITRSMVELEALINLSEETGVSIATVSGDIDLTNDVGRMVARILAAVARAEVERKGERLKLANRQRASQGAMHKGGIRPFGYNNDRQTINEPEAAIIRAAVSDILDGVPAVEVYRQWCDQGIRPPSGKEKFSLAGFNKLIRSPLLAGLRLYDGKVYQGDWEPILDKDTHMAIEAKFSSRQQPGRGRPRASLLAKIAVCSECGEVLGSDWQRDQAIYRCTMYGHSSTLREPADRLVEAYAVAYLASPEMARHVTPATGPGVSEMVAESDRLRLRLTELTDALDSDALTMEQFVELNTRTMKKIEEIETEILNVETDGAIGKLIVGAEDLAEQWLNADLRTKRDIVSALFEVTLHPAGRRKNVPISERLNITAKK